MRVQISVNFVKKKINLGASVFIAQEAAAEDGPNGSMPALWRSVLSAALLLVVAQSELQRNSAAAALALHLSLGP